MLEWTGPLNVTSEPSRNLFLHPKSVETGVYIWSVPVRGENWGYYVGETGTSFTQRHFEHLRAYFTGEYQIYDAERFATGRKTHVWKGNVGLRNCDDAQTFFENFDAYAPKAQAMISLLEFFLIPFSESERMRKRLEAAISAQLRAVDHDAKGFQDKIQYHPTRPDEEPVELQFSTPVPIVGLQQLSTIVLSPPT